MEYWASKIALDVERSIKRKSSNLTIIGFQIQVHVQYVMVIHSSVQNNPEMLPRLLGMILKQRQCQGQPLFRLGSMNKKYVFIFERILKHKFCPIKRNRMFLRAKMNHR